MDEEWDGNPEELTVTVSLPWNDVLALEQLFAEPGNSEFVSHIELFKESRMERLAEAEEDRAYVLRGRG